MIAASMWSRNRLCLWFLNLAFKSFGCLLLLSIWMKMQRMDVWDSLFIWYSKWFHLAVLNFSVIFGEWVMLCPDWPQNEQCRAHFGEFLQGYRSSAESVPSQPQIQNCDWFSRKAVTFFSRGLAAANSNHNLLKIITPLVWLVLGKTRHNFGRWGGLNRFFSECHLELVVIVYLISFDFMMDSGGNPSHVEIHAKFQSMIEISQFWSLMVFHSQGALTMISEQSSRRPMILNGSA